jgi:hypothetical protein
MLVVTLILALASPAAGQNDSLPSGTHARQGLLIGGVAGGAAGAVLLGLLAQGLCEYECDGAFVGGMIYGGAGGAVLGGLTGLVIGAAIPRGPSRSGPSTKPETKSPPRPPAEAPAGAAADEDRLRPWTVRLAVGPGWPVHTESGGVDAWVSGAVLRPTSSRVQWGLEAGYLGSRREVDVFTIPITPADTTVITTRWHRTLWSASFMALRTLGQEEHPAGYLLATAGIFPYRESTKGTRTGDPPDTTVLPPISEVTTRFLPGVGLGAGGRWWLGGAASVGVDARLNLVFGEGDDLGIGLASLSGVLWLGG